LRKKGNPATAYIIIMEKFDLSAWKLSEKLSTVTGTGLVLPLMMYPQGPGVPPT
jgi:hypothetical protein